MDPLRQIAASRLPITFQRAEDVDKVRVLRAAGLVIALVPAPSDPLHLSGEATAAQVLAVTQEGLEELDRHTFPDEHPRAPKERGPWLRSKFGRIPFFRVTRASARQQDRRAP
jgi:hypothetical protein